MRYKCPKCQAGWTLEEKYFLGGKAFSCDCGATTTVPLYCPTCDPPSKQEKTFLETPAGSLGGKEFACPKGHKYTVKVLSAEVQVQLAAWGTEIGKYSQRTGIETLRDAKLKPLMSGGYCSGATLDWIRRALGPDPKLAYTQDKLQQVTRVATAQSRQAKDVKQAFLDSTKKKLDAAMEQVSDAAWAQADLKEKQVEEKTKEVFEKLNSSKDMSRADKTAAFDKAQEAFDKAIARIRAERDEAIKAAKDKGNAWQRKSEMEKYWANFSREMDELLAKLKAKAGSPVKRKFSDLAVLKSIDTMEFPGVAALVATLLSEPTFQGNRAAYLNIDPPIPGVVGHAVAILRQNQGQDYHLFEPNFGTYKVSAEKLREAIVYLFTKAYPNLAGGNASDNKPYEINGKVHGRYTIFAGKLQAVPAPVPVLKPAAAATSERS
jgi:hypothetical protein